MSLPWRPSTSGVIWIGWLITVLAAGAASRHFGPGVSGDLAFLLCWGLIVGAVCFLIVKHGRADPGPPDRTVQMRSSFRGFYVCGFICVVLTIVAAFGDPFEAFFPLTLAALAFSMAAVNRIDP